MKKQKFINRTLKKLFREHMPPNMKKAKQKIEERWSLPNVERAAWEMYEYTPEDRAKIQEKLRKAAKEVINESGKKEVEVGLLASEQEDAEIERTFQAQNKTRALNLVKAYAEDRGYAVEEPPEGSESMSDWRFDGRRLTIIRK